MTRALAVPLICVVCLTAACAGRLMKLPTGAGIPAPDAADALRQATSACRGIRTLTAEMNVSGSAAGRRVRGRMLVGVAQPASVRLEALAPFGAPVFIFVANAEDATLLFPRDNRILEHGEPAAVLNAVAGVPLDAATLYSTLTGCAPELPQAAGSELGADWRVVRQPPGSDGGYTLFLHRDRPTEPWRLVATMRERSGSSWRAEYRDFQNDIPRSIRISGLAPADENGQSRFDLTLALSQIEINVPLDAAAFRVEIPLSADPITLEELRSARPGIREN